MALLLDTHTFLWWTQDSTRLSRRARTAIGRPEEDCLISIASCWEMAVTISLGRLTIPTSLDRFIAEQLAANGMRVLPLSLPHLAQVAMMPFHHRDPFDRLLAAQALVEGISLVSADRVFKQYGVTRIW